MIYREIGPVTAGGRPPCLRAGPASGWRRRHRSAVWVVPWQGMVNGECDDERADGAAVPGIPLAGGAQGGRFGLPRPRGRGAAARRRVRRRAAAGGDVVRPAPGGREDLCDRVRRVVRRRGASPDVAQHGLILRRIEGLEALLRVGRAHAASFRRGLLPQHMSGCGELFPLDGMLSITPGTRCRRSTARRGTPDRIGAGHTGIVRSLRPVSVSTSNRTISERRLAVPPWTARCAGEPGRP